MAAKKTATGGNMPRTSAAEGRLATLEALRNRLCEEIDITGDQRSLAVLSVQLRAVLSEIDSLLPYELPCPADQIYERRQARRRRYERSS